MNINDLFENLQKSLIDEIKGELILNGNCIVWSYDLDRNVEEIEITDDDEIDYDLKESCSPEELLQEVFIDDKEIIEKFIFELDDYTDYWSISEPEINNNIISFKIY